MKIDDATFNTDIPSELRRIENMLREQKLEQQWKKEGRGTGLAEEQETMQEWVRDQLEQGAAAEVQLKLPYRSKVRHSTQNPPYPIPTPQQLQTHNESTINNKNDWYEESLVERESQAAKGPGDRVQVWRSPLTTYLPTPLQYNGRNAMVMKASRGNCEVRWDKKEADGEESASVAQTDLVLLSKAHPALTITAEGRQSDHFMARHSRNGYRNTAVSSLSCLFSDADGINSPAFLQEKSNNRKAQVEAAAHERRKKMMISRAPQQGGYNPRTSTNRTSKLTVSSKFREKPQAGAKEMQISKEEGEHVGLVYDPETLCLLEAERDSPAEAFDKYRGMRITHVSTREEPQFSNDEGVHSGAQLRKALARAQESETVAVRFETWTQRRAVEKKKREFREKLVATKGRSGASTPRPGARD